MIHGGIFDGMLARSVAIVGALAASVIWLFVIVWLMGPPKPEKARMA